MTAEEPTRTVEDVIESLLSLVPDDDPVWNREEERKALEQFRRDQGDNWILQHRGLLEDQIEYIRSRWAVER